MKKWHKAWAVLGVFSATLLLWGCGGGGSSVGGNSQPGNFSISYAGRPTQAMIDANNAIEIVTTAYQGEQTGDELNIFGVVQSSGNGRVGNLLTLILAQILEKTVQKVRIIPTPYSGVFGIIVTESRTIEGPCGGSLSSTLSKDNDTGTFTGDFNFNGFCIEGSIISGDMRVSGQLNISTGAIEGIQLSFDLITVTSGVYSFLAAGDVAYHFDSSSVTVNMNIVFKGNTTEKVFWARDYIMTLTKGTGHVDVSWTGTFYHPDYGYVTIVTEEPLRINGEDIQPSSGVVLFSGRDSEAEFIVLSSKTFQVNTDTNGDRIYDHQSGALNWSDLSPVSALPPFPPTDVIASVGSGIVKIRWAVVPNASRYNLYVASVSGVTKDNYKTLPDGARYSLLTSPFGQVGFKNGTTYYFVVTAVSENGESEESTEVPATPTSNPAFPGLIIPIAAGNFHSLGLKLVRVRYGDGERISVDSWETVLRVTGLYRDWSRI